MRGVTTAERCSRQAGSLRLALAMLAGTPLPASAEGWERMPELLAWAVGGALVIMLALVLVVRLIDKGTQAWLPNPWLRPLLRNTLMFGAVAVTIYLLRGGELPPNMTIGVVLVVIVLKTLTDMLGSVGSALPPRRQRTRRASPSVRQQDREQERRPPEP